MMVFLKLPLLRKSSQINLALKYKMKSYGREDSWSYIELDSSKHMLKIITWNGQVLLLLVPELIKLSVLSISFHSVINSIARDFSSFLGEGGFCNLFWYFLRLCLHSCLLYSSALLLVYNQSVPNTDLEICM